MKTITISDVKLKSFDSLIGQSNCMMETCWKITIAAENDITVLITGESGTGKELVARAIHGMSPRVDARFVPLSCAAIPRELLEAELFGYRKGAFTGALDDREGLIERADGGTLYLNEIADASLAFQAKLLEVIETHEVRRLGENCKRRVDFRLIAATNHDIERAIEAGRFRADLFYRLNEVAIELPPLAQRENDAVRLAIHFVRNVFNGTKEYSREDLARFAEIVSSLDYGGNIRQLRASIGSLYLRSGGDMAVMIENCITECGISRAELIRRMLSRQDSNQSRVAHILGISESTLRRTINRKRQ